MAAKKPLPVKTADDLLKAMLVFSRSVDYVVETRAVEATVRGRVSSSKVQILRLLGQHGSQTSSQVARFLGVSKPAVSQIIDSMVRAKQVMRKPDADDRREVNLHLARNGRTMFQALAKAQRQSVRKAFGSVARADIKRWTDALHGMSRVLGNSDGAFKDFCAQCCAHTDSSCVVATSDSPCLFTKYREKSKKRREAAAGR